MPAPKPRKISDFKPTLSRLAQTSHYLLSFGGLPTALRQHLNVRDVGYRFITETSGLLCSSAVIPGSSFATADIVGNYMGVTEKMVHTRAFTEIQLEFYVDFEYKTIKFFEHWMEFIASGSGVSQASDGYFFRMAYPEDYKCNQTKIIKFDRDYKNNIEYTFYGMFPQSINSIPVSYGNSEILKATVTFNVDRYVAGRFDSYSLYRGNSNNVKTGISDFDFEGSSAIDVGFDATKDTNYFSSSVNYDASQAAGLNYTGNFTYKGPSFTE